MDAQIDHLVISSFRLWLDHKILEKGNAYTNKVAFPLYEEASLDPMADSTTYWSSDYQWVYDSSIAGATIPTGVSDGGSTVGRGTDGLHIDFENGRAVFTGGYTAAGDMTIDCAVKDINTYITTDEEERLIFETQFDRPPVLTPPTGAIAPFQYLAPCVFIRVMRSYNDPACMGGKDWTKWRVRNVVFGDDWEVYALEAIMRDCNHTCFMYFDAPDLPFDEFGDLKSPPFDYGAVAATYTADDHRVHIDSVEYSTYTAERVSDKNPSIRVGFADFELFVARHPRA